MAVLPWDASGVLAFLSFPGSAFLVSAISWISLALGLFFIVPSLLAVVFDILLWIWRTLWGSAQTPDARIPAAAGSAATIVTAAAATATTTIGSEHGDQRARRR